MKNLDLVNREEFEEIKSMIIKAREQNNFRNKIKTLEKKLKTVNSTSQILYIALNKLVYTI